MLAMVLKEPRKRLILEEVPKPVVGEGELLLRVLACGVCRTDLHIQQGDLSPKFPMILGHEVVGSVEEVGKKVRGFQVGDRVGVPWLGSTCGQCEFCKEERENLCDKAKFTGYDIPGGFAEYTKCKADFAIPLPQLDLSDCEIAPLLCAGLIGYRSYRKANPQKTIGFYGFGVAAHLLAQLAVKQGKEIYAFTRKGDREGQRFAKEIGAVWAGDSETKPPVLLDAAIIFAPVGECVPLSLKALKKGGRCVCGGIHMSDIPSFPYKDLWGEKAIESVANLTRKDGRDFFSLLPQFPIRPKVTLYSLKEVNKALEDFKEGKVEGAAVIDMKGDL